MPDLNDYIASGIDRVRLAHHQIGIPPEQCQLENCPLCGAIRDLTACLTAHVEPAVMSVEHLLHTFNRHTGICRCGDGPFTVPEWVEHYHTQETPTLTERTDR